MKRKQRRTFKVRVKKVDANFLQWCSRNRLRVLKMSIEAEPEWLKYLQEVEGIDTSGYPSQDTYVPELGITYHQVFFPNALKERFHQWLSTEYFPRHGMEDEEERQ